MGIEYQHFFAVSDPAWLPQSDTLSRVDAVLRRWSLLELQGKKNDLKLYQCERGPWRERHEKHVPVETPGSGLALCYRHFRWQAIAKILGPCLYPGPDDELYLDYVTLIAGTDFRVPWISEATFEFIVRQPARRNGIDIKPYYEDEAPTGLQCIYFEAFPAGAATTPPIVELKASRLARQHIGFEDFPGFWRAALMFDCHKCLPAFTDGKHVIPNREFVSDVSEAFRGPIAEIGLYC
jgi:hypothetical protein